MGQHKREESMLDEVAQAIAEQVLGQFLEWVLRQDEYDQVLADLQTVNAVLVRGAPGNQAGYQAAHDAAARLMALATTHGFVEMAEIFAGLSHGFYRTLGLHSSLEGADAAWHV